MVLEMVLLLLIKASLTAAHNGDKISDFSTEGAALAPPWPLITRWWYCDSSLTMVMPHPGRFLIEESSAVPMSCKAYVTSSSLLLDDEEEGEQGGGRAWSKQVRALAHAPCSTQLVYSKTKAANLGV